MPTIGAIILAAGNSSRMGQSKQLLKLHGESLIRRTACAALDAECDPVIIVTGAESAVAGEISDLPILIAQNPDWSRGIGTSIRRGLAAATERNPTLSAVVLMVCDQPHLSAKIVRDLIDTWTTSRKPIAASEYGGTLGTPCCFGNAVFADLEKLADGEGAKRVILVHPANVAHMIWPDGAVDLDTPSDLHDFH